MLEIQVLKELERLNKYLKPKHISQIKKEVMNCLSIGNHTNKEVKEITREIYNAFVSKNLQ